MSLAASPEELKKTIAEVAKRTQTELKPTKKRMGILKTLINDAEQRAKRLVARLGDEKDETIAAGVKDELKQIALRKTTHTNELNRLQELLDQQNWINQVTPDDIVRELREIGVTDNPQDQRKAFERYDVRF